MSTARSRRVSLAVPALLLALMLMLTAYSHFASAAVDAKAQFEWDLASALPRDLPGLGPAVLRLARRIEAMSDGRLKINVYAAGEMLPGSTAPISPQNVLAIVGSGNAAMGYATPTFWMDKIPAAVLFGTVPFGMDSVQFSAWIIHGDGLKLWRELYAPHGVVPYAAGGTGMQMAGWFVKPIRKVADFKGLKMRIGGGIGERVLQKLGAVAMNTPPPKILDALKTGALDAAQWKGPYNDMALGLNRSGGRYYYPGWQEPGGTAELLVNAEALKQLPEDLREVIRVATMAERHRVVVEYRHNNMQALEQLAAAGLKPQKLPQSVLKALAQTTRQVLGEMSRDDAEFAAIYKSYREFLLHNLQMLEVGEDDIVRLQNQNR